MNFQEIIDSVIPRPGCFVLLNDVNEEKHQDETQGERKFLDIFMENEKAEIVFSVFTNSKKNSIDLLNDAQILLA
jgi:hypothetical protein